jgi:hypothetical protein
MRLLTTAAIFLAASFPAVAGHKHHQRYDTQQRHVHSSPRPQQQQATHHRRKRVARAPRPHETGAPAARGGGIVTVATVAGPITVASHLASRFQALIADFVAAGYKPRHIGCYAHGGHVENSRHYSGAACDFDQRGWGLTASFMYRARAIIARHGFRDGCSFNDCGHVDDGQPVRHARRRWNTDNG